MAALKIRHALIIFVVLAVVAQMSFWLLSAQIGRGNNGVGTGSGSGSGNGEGSNAHNHANDDFEQWEAERDMERRQGGQKRSVNAKDVRASRIGGASAPGSARSLADEERLVEKESAMIRTLRAELLQAKGQIEELRTELHEALENAPLAPSVPHSHGPPFIFLYSTSTGPYQRYMSNLCEWSFHENKNEGEIYRLVSANDHSSVNLEEVSSWPVKEFQNYGGPNDGYYPYNKPGAVTQFLEEYLAKYTPEQADALDSTVVVMDPDMMFIKKFDVRVKEGHPISGQYPHFGINPKDDPEMNNHFSDYPCLTQPLGIPYIVHIQDLRKLAPLWLEKSRQIRTLDDPNLLDKMPAAGKKSWMTEMFGFQIAAASLLLKFDYIHKCVTLPPYENVVNQETYFLHYNYHMFVGPASEMDKSPWHFHKRVYFGHGKEMPRFLITEPPAEASDGVKRAITWLNKGLKAVWPELEYPPPEATMGPAEYTGLV